MLVLHTHTHTHTSVILQPALLQAQAPLYLTVMMCRTFKDDTGLFEKLISQRLPQTDRLSLDCEVNLPACQATFALWTTRLLGHVVLK